MISISVVLVNYNVRHFLQLCLLSVQAALQGIESEIIVVDNHSTDDSLSILPTLFPDVRWIKNTENVGFAKANNQGVTQASGQYVLLLNPDTVVPENLFTKLLAFALAHPNAGAIGVPLYDGKGQFLPESKRNTPTPLVSLAKFAGLDHAYYAHHLAPHQSGAVDILTGAFMFMERDKYQEVGGLDESYFMYGEDIDLSYTFCQKGFVNYYFAGTPVLHFKGESTFKDALYLQHFYHAMQNFYQKHYQPSFLAKGIIHTGIRFWRAVHALKLRQKRKDAAGHPKKILYVGSENETFVQLQTIYQNADIYLFAICESRVISRYDDLEGIRRMLLENNIDEVVFDQQNLTFDKIIFLMTQLANEQVSFKIHPKQSGILMGSNDRNTKGVVLHLPT